jgi:predicted MFS family arabinose efflux permease
MRITDNNNNLSQLIIIFLGIVQIIATFIGGKMMDKWSKRYFLFVGEICMVFILAFIFIFNQNIGLVVTLIFMHSIAYSFSIGQLLLFYAAKMLDSTGYVVMANWFATFLVAISA